MCLYLLDLHLHHFLFLHYFALAWLDLALLASWLTTRYVGRWVTAAACGTRTLRVAQKSGTMRKYRSMASLNRSRYCLGVTIVGSRPPPRIPDSLTQLSNFLSHVNVRIKSSMRKQGSGKYFSYSPITGQRGHMCHLPTIPTTSSWLASSIPTSRE